MALLEIKNLNTYFVADTEVIKAVNGVSLSVEKGDSVAIVGGSGSGKTVLALSILRLIDESCRIVSGEILFDGDDVVKMSDEKLRSIRGRKISMIFQEPMSSLNPVLTIGDQIEESILVHDPKLSRAELISRSIELLNIVGIKDPDKKITCYPFELSGGMRQRVMIAMAIASRPDILIADEPTTALDVTIQAQILELLRDLQKKFSMTLILITHDFGIVSEMAKKVFVMHNGKIVESGSLEGVFNHPKDEYTKKLLEAAL